MNFRNLWLAMVILFVPPRKHNLMPKKKRWLSVLVVLYRMRTVINCVVVVSSFPERSVKRGNAIDSKII